MLEVLLAGPQQTVARVTTQTGLQDQTWSTIDKLQRRLKTAGKEIGWFTEVIQPGRKLGMQSGDTTPL
eukprot:9144021-Prorocentrum_lima.AAC.1